MEKKSAYITLRCQPSLKNKIRSLAEQEHRSISKQVIYLLELGIEKVERDAITSRALTESSERIKDDNRGGWEW